MGRVMVFKALTKLGIKSRRLTYMFDLYGELFNEGVAQWYFLTDKYEYFPKTIISSRKATKKYLGGENG